MVSLLEGGTHVLFGTRMGSYARSELALAEEVIGGLEAGMLCLADRHFYGFELWRRARATGADLLWRVKKNQYLPCEQRLRDGSYLSTVYAPRPQRSGGVRVRVVEYRLEGVEESEPLYRLVTSVLDPERAPARELAALYHERWEIETAFDELKTHLRGARMVLRSKTPELVKQEFFGLLLAHYAVRKLYLHSPAPPATAPLPALQRRTYTRSDDCMYSRQAATVRSYPPLRTGRRCMRPFWTRSWTSRWIPVAAAGTRAG